MIIAKVVDDLLVAIRTDWAMTKTKTQTKTKTETL